MAEGAREQGQEAGRMSRRAAAWLAWFLWALCVGFVVLGVLLDFYTPPTRHEPNFAVLA